MSIIVDMHDDHTNLEGQNDQMMEHGVPITDINDHNSINKVILVK